jgi:hypothetical protein
MSASPGIVGAPFVARFGAAMFAKMGIIANLFSLVLFDRAGAGGRRILVVIRSRCDSHFAAPTAAENFFGKTCFASCKTLDRDEKPCRICFLQAARIVFAAETKAAALVCHHQRGLGHRKG